MTPIPYYMSSTEILESFSLNLFWDADVAQIDMSLHAPYIVQRVLEYGLYEDWQLLLQYYGLDAITVTAKGLRTLEPTALAFISAISHTPKEQFRCCTFRRSIPTLWNS